MATRASIKALTDPNNMKTRWTHKKIAYNALKDCELTIREIAKKVVKPYNAIQKRISELLEEGYILECGTKLESGQSNTMFKINPNLAPGNCDNKPTLRRWLKYNYPSILAEYEAMVLHRL